MLVKFNELATKKLEKILKNNKFPQFGTLGFFENSPFIQEKFWSVKNFASACGLKFVHSDADGFEKKGL